ncbi:Fur family transcriptional regulator [Pokkaliibacter plantistimulans]|uniref:Ferric uptake regulation protein n=1 Tax=Pokkaliibacter plantistimulans TaxID=1635171 RepID=A0ABX5LZI0_9GAMM|nr:Fur family transcriptional regulator [Pokkaliibacter plantistimulans]PXF30711.1 Fur family transcriptional regulator [Pokkaliibacter plantistimulans]
MSGQDSSFQPHDHQHCIHSALATAKRLCLQRGVRFTPVRERVLELIWQSHKPLGAYELLPQLAQDGYNSAPPTVYRALDFLQEQGLVHRIASLNAFIGCTSPAHRHTGYFFLCSQCGAALEINCDAIDTAIHSQASEQGFQIQHQTLEVVGLCPACQ